MITEEHLQDIFELADLLSGGDIEVYLTLKEAVFATDPEVILEQLEKVFDLKAFERFLTNVGDSEIDNLFLILIYLLEARGHLCVQTDSDSLLTFVQDFQKLRIYQELGVQLFFDGTQELKPDDSILTWCQQLGIVLGTKGYLIGNIQMDFNDHHLFLFSKEKEQTLRMLGQRLGKKIEFISIK